MSSTYETAPTYFDDPGAKCPAFAISMRAGARKGKTQVRYPCTSRAGHQGSHRTEGYPGIWWTGPVLAIDFDPGPGFDAWARRETGCWGDLPDGA